MAETAPMMSVEDYERRILSVARGELGSEDWQRYVGAEVPGASGRLSWCQIFGLWCWHQAGLARHRRWQIGTGIVPAMPIVAVDRARPGDMLYMHRYNHGALFVSRLGDIITTIDGNTMTDLDGDGTVDTYSGVSIRTRPASDWAACVSVHDDIASAVRSGAGDDAPDTEPAPALLELPRATAVSRRSDDRWRALQRGLADRGHYQGRIDGDPGPLTVTAIVRDWWAMRQEV